MKFHFELGNNTEVATASAKGPKQVRVLPRVATHDGAIRSDKGEAFDVVAGQPETSSEPSCASSQYQSRSPSVRDDAGGKDQARLLRSVVNRSEQAAASEIGAACVGIHSDLAHPREIDYETVIASTETSETMTAAPHGCENSGSRGDPDRALHVANVRTACDESWLLGNHAVPNGTRIFVTMMLGPQQIAFESPSERGIRLLDYFRHCLRSLRFLGAECADTAGKSKREKQRKQARTIAIPRRRRL